MRKFLLIAALFSTALCIEKSNAQTAATGVATYKVSNPLVNLSGSFAQPSQYVPANANGQNSEQIFPWYTKLDSVTNTGTDTFKCKIGGLHESIYSWVHITSITGTNTACVLKLYASADSGKGVDFAPVYTVTVTATNPVASYAFPASSYYTNFWWVFVGSGTQLSSWYSGLNVR